MTAFATDITVPGKAAKTKVNRGEFDASASSEEWKFAGLAAAILAAWIGAAAAFGYAGLIVGALTMVAVMYVMLIIISRG